MKTAGNYSPALQGALLATLACIIWSGNFIVARSAATALPPVMLALLRWACASVVMLPLSLAAFKAHWPHIKQHKGHLLLASLTGVVIFNTMVYKAGQYTTAINLALISTTSSPAMSFVLARIFLKEQITGRRLAGLLICMAGVLLLLSRGRWQVLATLQFTKGDWWILLGALMFATYNIVVRKKPASLPPRVYLASTFWLGTLLLLPWALVENQQAEPWQFTPAIGGMVLYLGAGASVISFFCWNAAITRLGAARTSLFGNLIPIFASLEAVWLLHEHLSWLHITSMAIVIGGLVLANLPGSKSAPYRQ